MHTNIFIFMNGSDNCAVKTNTGTMQKCEIATQEFGLVYDHDLEGEFQHGITFLDEHVLKFWELFSRKWISCVLFTYGGDTVRFGACHQAQSTIKCVRAWDDALMQVTGKGGL